MGVCAVRDIGWITVGVARLTSGGRGRRSVDPALSVSGHASGGEQTADQQTGADPHVVTVEIIAIDVSDRRSTSSKLFIPIRVVGRVASSCLPSSQCIA